MNLYSSTANMVGTQKLKEQTKAYIIVQWLNINDVSVILSYSVINGEESSCAISVHLQIQTRSKYPATYRIYQSWDLSYIYTLIIFVKLRDGVWDYK